jgi:4-alpha-glucanotransferase
MAVTTSSGVDEKDVMPPQRFPRSAGVLLHPTSLPGPGGIGTWGPDALRFVRWMADAGLSLWQVLPLGPTGFGDSPYQSFSAFAGNPLLVHLPESAAGASARDDAVDFAEVVPAKLASLRVATATWRGGTGYDAWCRSAAWWLDDFALFMAAKQAHDGAAWTAWDPALSRREPTALLRWRDRLKDDVEHHRRVQFLYHAQFSAVRAACHAAGIRMMGDVPMYVAHDSADVWAQPNQFQLDEAGHPTVQAGVPPDYFSATGQLWGNPLYAWDRMRDDSYAWWARRLRAAFTQFDLLRLDHFRGFDAYWEVPAGAATAAEGRWVDGPGLDVFEALTQALGPLPVVAENLGVITPTVEALRERCGFAGMAVLQFAFADAAGPGGERTAAANPFLPHRHERHQVVYTGTHDNDTVAGWWTATPDPAGGRTTAGAASERAFACAYLGAADADVPKAVMRAALASVADTVLLPLQDVLGLGAESRMNQPGRAEGNWRFRATWEQCTPAVAAALRVLVTRYERLPAAPTAAGSSVPSAQQRG